MMDKEIRNVYRRMKWTVVKLRSDMIEHDLHEQTLREMDPALFDEASPMYIMDFIQTLDSDEENITLSDVMNLGTLILGSKFAAALMPVFNGEYVTEREKLIALPFQSGNRRQW